MVFIKDLYIEHLLGTSTLYLLRDLILYFHFTVVEIETEIKQFNLPGWSFHRKSMKRIQTRVWGMSEKMEMN